MQGIRAAVADMIFERGALEFGSFKLKKHEENPDAPLSPFYFNLRTPDNPKPGPLTKEDCMLIALALRSTMKKAKLSYEAVAAIPNAADPFVEAMRMGTLPPNVRIIKLAKKVTDIGRRIVPMAGFEYRLGEIVLLIDDLVTKAGSKLEAIRAIEASGSVVRNVVVLIDREEGGRVQLEKAGYKLYSCFSIFELLDFYLAAGKIDKSKHWECVNYIMNS